MTPRECDHGYLPGWCPYCPAPPKKDTTMKTLKHLALALLLFTICTPLTACDTLSGVGVDWPDAVQCGSRAADDLFPAVSTILLDDAGETMSPMAKRDLEKLAVKHGADVVACLVDRLIQRWTAPGATSSPERSDAVKRATAWQDDIGTEVQRR